MSYLNKNINLFLFLLIILVVLSMVGGTIFYGGRFTNITVDYNDLVKEVEELNLELIKFKAQYNVSQALLDKTETEKNNLKKVYTTQTGRLESEAQQLNDSLASSQLKLKLVEDELVETKDKLESAEDRVESRGVKLRCYRDFLADNSLTDTCD